MIRRHPHVFSTTEVKDSKEVLQNWESIKRAEKAQDANQNESITPIADSLRDIPVDLPALHKAQRISDKAGQRANFEWPNLRGVLDKIEEEHNELLSEIETLKTSPEKIESPKSTLLEGNTKEKVTHEIGDLLFTVVQVARWLGINAEESLHSCVGRFLNRFEEMEKHSKGPLKELSDKAREALWKQIKDLESKP